MMNKKIIFTCLTILILFPAKAEDTKRETVHSIVKVAHDLSWFQNQAELWNDYLQKNDADAAAWLNYYTAQRMLKICGGEKTQADLNRIVETIKSNVPNSFEYHYIAFWNSDFKDQEANFYHLQKAYELAPDRSETMDEFMTYYEMKRDKQKLKEVSKKWFASNDIAPGLFFWNYNMLQSVEENAILITSADNDTYPAWVIQYANDVRTDVNVLNYSLLGADDYRERYFKEMGIPSLNQNMQDFETYPKFQEAILKHLKSNTNRPIYFSVSTNPELYASFKKDIYNVGMAYKWSDAEFDNIAVTKRNYERKYLLDYLSFESSNHISNGVVDIMNGNYLISLLPLYNHYTESDDNRKIETEQLIKRIAKKGKMEEKVNLILNKANRNAPSLVINDPRDLEKGMVKIKNNFYASATEITNASYELFLTDLLKQKRYADLDVAKAEIVDWRNLLPASKKNLSDAMLFPNGHPSAANFPVVNISYQAANLYCAWLTEIYNNIDHRKKKYGEVIFRLPTEAEWEEIALGGNEKSDYAWGGSYIRNTKGCFLANLKVNATDGIPKGKAAESCTPGKEVSLDGGCFPVAAETYFPNAYGLYNMTGNVAEMVSEQGVAKGGSWNTPAGMALISSKETITSPSPEVGFRIVMIVK